MKKHYLMKLKYIAVYRKGGTMINTDEYIVPKTIISFMGDNRDCSKDRQIFKQCRLC